MNTPDFNRYASLVDEEDLLLGLIGQQRELAHLFGKIPEADSLVLHSPYQWSIRQVLQHINDCERVFAYRLLRIARGDATPLPSFDENLFARNAKANEFPLLEHLSEFDSIRASTIHLVKHLAAEAWDRVGTAADRPLRVRDLVRILIGHARHHGTIVQQRALGTGIKV